MTTPQSQIDELAKIIWDYHHLHQTVTKSEAILVLCSSDRRVAERGAQLYLDGYGKWLVFAGGLGYVTRSTFAKPEAQLFAEIAVRMGVPATAILIEDRSTTTTENIQLSYELMQRHDIHPASIILVQKPYMERRAYAAFKKLWPGQPPRVTVTSPQLSYEDYLSPETPRDLVINLMVGDLQRVKELPRLGFQIKQPMPKEVWAAGQELIELGFNERLMTKLAK
jgi:uncharacterized SAM-binding protein YcdF (DUF218 family)